MQIKNETFFLIAAWLIILSLSGCKLKNETSGQDSRQVTLSSLLAEMADRESITRFPDYTLKQVSSWDRTQKGPDDSKTWFNNADYGFYIRKEINDGREEYVILDEMGPGCIVRWWIPLEHTYKDRILRIYLDGMKDPVIEENYHDLISGNSFVGEPFAFISSDEKDSVLQRSLPIGHPKQMGADFYLPVPFSKGCKITLDDNPFYYVINYRMYDPEKKVESFTRRGFDESIEAMRQSVENLSADYSIDYGLSEQQIIQPGEVMSLDLPAGSHAVRSIRIRFVTEPDKQTLRSSILRLYFDQIETGWCPVSEFFGGGVYLRPVRNRATTVRDNGVLQSDWVMPYQQSGFIQLKNYGMGPVTVEMKIAVSAYVWEASSMYFHANWHEEAPVRTISPVDFNYIKIRGQGVYAGDVLTVHAFSKGWWGEGDEKIYLDDEPFPSHLGTGLEDYYGYAWGMAHVFSSPFISVPLRDARGKADWSGYTTVSRIRLLDAIPFNTALDVNVEAWLHDSTVSYSNATYWYARPEATSNRKSEENSVKRPLPDYSPQAADIMPGTIYPDPAANGLTRPEGDGSVKHAGNHIDLLDWREPKESKTRDADGNNHYGTAGYHLINCRRLDVRPIRFQEDSVKSLPVFVESLKLLGKSHWEIQDSWLSDPKQPDIRLITGAVIASGKKDHEAEIIQITLKGNIPGVFRLGIMTDNLNDFSRIGKSIRVTSSPGGDSGPVMLARSNRVPDWYFFDIFNSRSGGVITITGPGQDDQLQMAAIGGITFDIPVKNE